MKASEKEQSALKKIQKIALDHMNNYKMPSRAQSGEQQHRETGIARMSCDVSTLILRK